MRRSVLFAVAMLVMVPIGATADVICADRAALVRVLDQRHGEQLVALHLQGPRMAELHASDATGTWTIILTDAGGRSCLATSGHGYAGAASAPGAWL